MKINLGFNSKRYTRDMSNDVNTTFGFGEVQPTMCQFMLPDADIKVSSKSLVRLSPLKVPSFARVHMESVARFVPMADIFGPWESFLSNIPFSNNNRSFVPSTVPLINPNFLLMSLLGSSQWSVYNSSFNLVTTPPSALITTGYLSTALLGFNLPNYSNSQFALSDAFNRKTKDNAISLDSADYIIKVLDSASSTLYIALRLNAAAQRMRKIYVGLGYDICVQPSSTSSYLKVSLLPLLAFYKAYYDTYETRRYTSFTNTPCYALIELFNHLGSGYDFSSLDSITPVLSYLYNFLSSFNSVFYSAQDDYISIHQNKPLNTAGDGLSNTLTVQGNNASSFYANQGRLPQSTNTGSLSSLDSVMLKTLVKFTNFVSKDSVIGQRMSEWTRQHFNADVANQLFKDCNFIGRGSMPLSISDVFSTSDTATSNGDGEYLGAYAGKGIGYSDNIGFKFHSSVHGYFIILTCIAPDSRTFQGTDAELIAKSRYDFPTPEFDALGYEITDKRVFISSNDINVASDANISFGYVPRYTGFKYKKNIVNGDMSRRSTMQTFSPYFLDRIITKNYLYKASSSAVPQIKTNNVPSASPNWRFITRYGYLGDFNRLFIVDENYQASTDYTSDDAYNEVADNFLGQIIYNVSMTDALKPLKRSYDTVASDDNNVKSINAV